MWLIILYVARTQTWLTTYEDHQSWESLVVLDNAPVLHWRLVDLVLDTKGRRNEEAFCTVRRRRRCLFGDVFGVVVNIIHSHQQNRRRRQRARLTSVYDF